MKKRSLSHLRCLGGRILVPSLCFFLIPIVYLEQRVFHALWNRTLHEHHEKDEDYAVLLPTVLLNKNASSLQKNPESNKERSLFQKKEKELDLLLQETDELLQSVESQQAEAEEGGASLERARKCAQAPGSACDLQEMLQLAEHLEKKKKRKGSEKEQKERQAMAELLRLEIQVLRHKQEHKLETIEKRAATTKHLPTDPLLPTSVANTNTNTKSNHSISSHAQEDYFETLFQSQERQRMQQNFSSFFDAQDAHGKKGYIADPTSLQRGIKHFLAKHKHKGKNAYFDVLEHYPSQHQGTPSNNTSLNLNATCFPAGGEGMEQPNGFKLLAQKIQIAPNPPSNQPEPKLLCLLYTHPGKREAARASALTWGVKCDGFLAFSTETLPHLGHLSLIHPGPEHYNNMWQKIRAIWGYVGLHYLHDYDYFHIGGDDLYLVVENLRRFIRLRLEPHKNKPIITGAHAKVWEQIDGVDYLLGGPGYTLNRLALQRFVDDGLTAPECFADVKGCEEDQYISKCFQHHLKIPLFDSHDPESGQQLFHHVEPHRVYEENATGTKYFHLARKYWANLPHPSKPKAKIGDLTGLDAAHQHSVAFHFVKTPSTFGRFTAILYRLCPRTTPLGQSLYWADHPDQMPPEEKMRFQAALQTYHRTKKQQELAAAAAAAAQQSSTSTKSVNAPTGGFALQPLPDHSQPSARAPLEYSCRLQGMDRDTPAYPMPLACGTKFQKRQLEGFQIRPTQSKYAVQLRYRAQVEGQDTGWKPLGRFVGTPGRRLEGFAVQLLGQHAEQYDVYYSAHIELQGDTGWVRNGAYCGSAPGVKRRVEAIAIYLADKPSPPPQGQNQTTTQPPPNTNWVGVQPSNRNSQQQQNYSHGATTDKRDTAKGCVTTPTLKPTNQIINKQRAIVKDHLPISAISRFKEITE